MEKEKINLYKIIKKIFSIVFYILALAYIFMDFSIIGYYSSGFFKNLFTGKMDSSSQVMAFSLIITAIILVFYLLIFVYVKKKYPKSFIAYNFVISGIVNTVLLKKINGNAYKIRFIKNDNNAAIAFYAIVLILSVIATMLKVDFLDDFKQKLQKLPNLNKTDN